MDNNSASTEFKQLIAKGKEQGYLTIDEINDLIKDIYTIHHFHVGTSVKSLVPIFLL